MYSISVWPPEHKRHTIQITSGEILASLDKTDPAQARAAKRIAEIELNGVRYCNQHFDVLSHALRLAGGRTGRCYP